jgi:hypothetical protein
MHFKLLNLTEKNLIENENEIDHLEKAITVKVTH